MRLKDVEIEILAYIIISPIGWSKRLPPSLFRRQSSYILVGSHQ
jgi:hypothetical protein